MTHGHAWNGLFIRKNFKHFHEIRRRLDELIMKGLPARRTGGPSQTNYLYFKNGAQVMLTAIESPEKLDFFLGSAHTEISVEEATTFPFIDQLVNQLRGCLRSAHGVKCTMFLTSNPGGVGHNFVKSKFISPAKQGGVPIKEREDGDTKIFIPSNVEDNRILVENDPKYKQKLDSIEDPELRRAWLFGDWDVVLGGFFDDIWNQQKSKIVIPYFRPPKHWDRIVGFDWGSARPFSVGWYAISGGEYIPELGRALPRGALIRFFEWYGCVKERPNTGLRMESRDVARQILELEAKHDLVGHAPPDRIADPAVFKQEDGPSIGEKMAEQGVVWRRGDNKRIPGWDIMRSLMRGEMSDWEVMTDESGNDLIINAVHEPMLYITENCKAWIRTVPVLERDEKEPEDLEKSGAEDHPLHPETLVHTSNGFYPIKNIEKNGFVYTIHGQLTPYYNCRITRRFSDIVQIVFEDRQQEKCSPEHEFLTTDGFVRAYFLQGYEVRYNFGNGDIGKKKVTEVHHLNEKSDVYCMTVPETEIFEIEGGILTHNCADECRYVCASRPGHGKSMLDAPEPKGAMELEHEEIQAIGREGEDLEMPRVIQNTSRDPLKDSFSAADEFEDEW